MKRGWFQKAIALSLVFSMNFGSVVMAKAAVREPVQEKFAEASEAESMYQNNQGALRETPLLQLPLGAVRADGWLENQMLLMKNGLTGNMKYFSDYNKETSAWLGAGIYNSHASWENAPYFVRGLVALAYALNDSDLIDEALEWIAWSIDTQRPDGYFGPAGDDAWWSRMPMLCAIRDFYEAVDEKPLMERTEKEMLYHGKVLEFLANYFRYQQSELPGRPLSNWADARGGDNLEIVYWLYNKLYDENNPDETDWLLDLGDLIYSQTVNWEEIYNDSTVRQHVVNTSQGMKTPAIYSQYKDEEKYRTALANGIDNMGIDHGRIDGLPNSDEAARDNRSTRGSETCGTVEGLLSTGIALKISGEAWMGDRMETLAYNALPAAYPSDYSGHTYYILQNQVMNTLGNHEFDCDHGDSSAFGAPLGYDCCFANNHMGWAKFVQNMWMATRDGGLALTAYGPNHVTAKVAGGKTAKFQQKTDYPFRDTVNLTYCGEAATFDLQLRIPEWAVSAEVRVNGIVQEGVNAGAFYSVSRTWQSGDEITAVFRSEIRLTTWYNNSTAVQKGALVYGLKIDEDWRTYEENDARELKAEHREGFPLREVYPASAWNYGLVTDENAVFDVIEEEEVGLQPFSAENAPISIKAKGQILPEWTLDGNIAGPQPYGPIAYDKSRLEDITLIPYGCSRLRITHFPTLGDEIQTGEVVRTESNTVIRNGVTYQEFDNLVVPKAKDYHLVVKAKGSGAVIINGKYSQEVSGDFTIKNLKNKLSGYFKFDAGQYNNIRFTGDIKISELKIEIVEREITEIHVLNMSRSGSTIKITTNLDVQETPYRIVYGTASGEYTDTVRGFASATAVLTGMDEDTVYYAKIFATICGVEQESEELILETSQNSGGLKPNPNVPAATYEGFNTLNYMTGEQGVWTEYDPENAVTIQAASHANSMRASEIKLGTSERMKAVLDVEGSANWVDYVAEAEITVDEVKINNGGLMFRAGNFGDGPDSFQGYFAGIGLAGGKPGLMIGYADGSWHDIKIVPMDIRAGQKYTVKAVVYGTHIAIFVDDVPAWVFEDDRFSKGTVGVRSYRESMTVHNVTVRSIAEEDLKVFETEESGENPEPKPEVPANFRDDFSSDENWNKIGDENLIMVSEGAIHLGKSINVKAAAGDTEWSNYVYKADVRLEEGNGNAGILLRCTKEGSGADNYYGYYFGLNGNAFEIGKSSNRWEQLTLKDYKVDTSIPHELKAVVYEDAILFYIDGEHVHTITDSDHARGRIGVRGYNRAFSVDNVEVRPLTEEEIIRVHDAVEASRAITIEGVSACESFQIKYPRVANATSYKVLFGTKSGVYTNEFTDVYFNGYKGSGIFSHDKVAVSALEEGTYYVKMLGLNGNTIVAVSNEITVTTGERAKTGQDKAKLAAAIEKESSLDDGNFTWQSRERLERAKAYADLVAEKTCANQIEYATATALLNMAMNTPDSTNFEEEPEPVEKPADTTALDKAEAAAKQLDAGKYTAESYAKVKAALAAIEKIDRKRQEAVDAAVKLLEDAIAGLKLKTTEAPRIPEKGEIVYQGTLIYKVTKSAVSGGTAAVVKPADKNCKNITIPASISINGYNFKVTSVSSSAFKNCRKLKSIRIGNSVSQIGKYAFKG